MKVALKQITDTPRPLAEIAPGTPKALVQITEKAMAKLPANRYASAREMLDALGQYIHDPDVVFAYKYITEEAPEKVVKQTMSQRKDPRAGTSGARSTQKRKKSAPSSSPRCWDHGGLCGGLRPAVLMILHNGSNFISDQKADIVLEDYVGMTRTEAEAIDQVSSNQINIDWVEEYSSTYSEGYIYKQSPAAGRVVREGQTVNPDGEPGHPVCHRARHHQLCPGRRRAAAA